MYSVCPLCMILCNVYMYIYLSCNKSCAGVSSVKCIMHVLAKEIISIFHSKNPQFSPFDYINSFINNNPVSLIY